MKFHMNTPNDEHEKIAIMFILAGLDVEALVISGTNFESFMRITEKVSKEREYGGGFFVEWDSLQQGVFSNGAVIQFINKKKRDQQQRWRDEDFWIEYETTNIEDEVFILADNNREAVVKQEIHGTIKKIEFTFYL